MATDTLIGQANTVIGELNELTQRASIFKQQLELYKADGLPDLDTTWNLSTLGTARDTIRAELDAIHLTVLTEINEETNP